MRPSGGEMTMLSVLSTALCIGVATFFSTVFDSEQDLRRMNNKAEDLNVTVSEISREDDDEKGAKEEDSKDSKKGNSRGPRGR
jgi:hypothetical protein